MIAGSNLIPCRQELQGASPAVKGSLQGDSTALQLRGPLDHPGPLQEARCERQSFGVR
jgi:hypothetical protein